ncbi:MAG TPA: hypothetical protein VHY22_11605 [Chthoniobacteraceae bacterium]|jgi:hypothetical protein|nr:hypothetical protein [Chthoniobacteraceae bacterium]
MKIKTILLLLIGMALAMPATRAFAQRTQGGSNSGLSVGASGTGAFTGAMAGLTGTNYGIEGTAHDFSQTSWISRNDVCGTCHVPHAPDQSQIVPLWEHATTTQSFNVFQSAQLTSLGITIPQPSGVSLACLSCHDGTLGVNQSFTGITGNGGVPVPMSSWNNAYVITGTGSSSGNDLSHVHPISFNYDTVQAAEPQELNPATGQVPTYIPNQTPGIWSTSWPIGKAVLVGAAPNGSGGTMECGSCHDVHAQIGAAASGGLLLKIGGVDNSGGNRGSTLCRTCHIK